MLREKSGSDQNAATQETVQFSSNTGTKAFQKSFLNCSKQYLNIIILGT